MFALNTDLSQIPGVGPKFTTKLKKLKITTIKDLLWHFPFRYEDFSKIIPIDKLELNQPATIQGVVQRINLRRTWKKKITIVEAVIADETGGVKAVWFNQPYIAQILRSGTRANFAGKLIQSPREIYLSSPAYEITSSRSLAGSRFGPKHTAGLIPIYPETRGLTSKGLRFLIKPLLKDLDKIDDFIPSDVLRVNKLPEINLALRKIHFPLKLQEADLSKKRFAFEDLFLLQLNNLKIKSRLAQEKAVPIQINQNKLKSHIQNLPYQLTNSQKESLKEIMDDLQRTQPMNRLLQGDVGSGKTIIAALAALLTAQNELQTAFLAPTEVLASQHYYTITKIFPNFDSGIALLTANHAKLTFGKGLEEKISKPQLVKEIADGKVKIVIGTHAIIQKNIHFANLAFTIVDEQHRFGVEQRAALATKKELRIKNNEEQKTPIIHNSQFVIPHFLSMSATPIPRTLSLTIFGDLDLSTITELPAGRKTIITRIVAPGNRQKAYAYIREQIKKGRQAFVICPRIEPGALKEGQILTDAKKKAMELKSVKEEFEKLSTQVFPDLKVVMLHGKLKGKDKDQIMRDFSNKKSDILVSTSVVELGVDIPNATIMMIEGSERFGLAQLYQFRGRVGRGEHQSFCLLFTDSESESIQRRLNSLLTAKNGFELAEKDLSFRGPGQFLGEEQSGLPDIAMDALKDIQLVKAARISAQRIISGDPSFKEYPLLSKRFQQFQKQIHLE